MTGPERRFSLADGMGLIAATAVGLAGGLVPYARPGLRTGWQFDPVIGSVWLALSLSMATLWSRARPPRPPWSRLTRQPGFIACVVVVVTSLAAILSLGEGMLAGLVEGGWPVDPSRLLWSVGTNLTFNTRYAVMAAWTIQAISGRWRPEPCWLDRLGLALGGYWLAAPTLVQCARALNALW